MTSATGNVVPSAAHGQTATSGCLLPFIEGTAKKKEAKSTNISVPNDFIPSDLLLSLKRFTGSDHSQPPKGTAALPSSKKNPTLPPNKQVRMKFLITLLLITSYS